jgi:hypothetical protein
MSSDDPESELYNDLSPQSLSQLIVLQSIFRTWSQVSERKKRSQFLKFHFFFTLPLHGSHLSLSPEKMSCKRERVALELLQTEREYVGNLNTLISVCLDHSSFIFIVYKTDAFSKSKVFQFQNNDVSINQKIIEESERKKGTKKKP